MRMATIESPYLTTREAMAYLNVSRINSFYRFIREHGMPFCRMGRHYRFDRRELDAWMHGHASAIDQVRALKRVAS